MKIAHRLILSVVAVLCVVPAALANHYILPCDDDCRDAGHLQIAGTPGRHEPDIGEINYEWLLRRIDELSYDGWVGCEYRPLATTVAGLSWRDRLVPLRPTE